jgi:hypothetical protein
MTTNYLAPCSLHRIPSGTERNKGYRGCTDMQT